jgi:hypothetical protein
MGTSANQHANSALPSPPNEVEITVWPLHDDPLRSWSLVLGVVALSALAGWVAASFAMGLFCLAAILVALWRMWVPVTFHLGPRGIVQTVLGRQTRFLWSSVARFEVHSSGVLLLPDADPTPLNKLRSLYIRFQGEKVALLELVDYYVVRPSHVGDSTLTQRTGSTSQGEPLA